MTNIKPFAVFIHFCEDENLVSSIFKFVNVVRWTSIESLFSFLFVDILYPFRFSIYTLEKRITTTANDRWTTFIHGSCNIKPNSNNLYRYTYVVWVQIIHHFGVCFHFFSVDKYFNASVQVRHFHEVGLTFNHVYDKSFETSFCKQSEKTMQTRP